MKKLLFISCILLIYKLSFSQVPLPQSGQMGDSLFWEIAEVNPDDPRRLIITGRGVVSLQFVDTIRQHLGMNRYGLARFVTSLVFGEGITGIDSNTFTSYCWTKYIKFPSSLKFLNCRGITCSDRLEKFDFAEGLERIERPILGPLPLFKDSLVLPNSLYYVKGRFASSQIPYLLLSNGMDTIYTDQFCANSQLKTLILPAHISVIEQRAFLACTSLSQLYNLNVTPQKIDTTVFQKVRVDTCKLIVPTSAVTAYQNAPIWKDFIIIGGGLSLHAYANNVKIGYVTGFEQRLFNQGEVISISAIERNGGKFKYWANSKGEILSYQNPFSFTINSDTNIMAVFNDHTTISEKIINKNIRIFPNPVSDYLHIDNIENIPIENIEIFDIVGRKMAAKQHNNFINMENLTKGIYFVKISTTNGYIVKKVVKQ